MITMQELLSPKPIEEALGIVAETSSDLEELVEACREIAKENPGVTIAPQQLKEMGRRLLNPKEYKDLGACLAEQEFTSE